MNSDDFSGMMSDNLNSRINYFLDEIRIAWNSYIKQEIIKIPNKKDTDPDSTYQNAVCKYKVAADLLIKTIQAKEEKENENIEFNDNEKKQYSMISMMLSGAVLEVTIRFFLIAYIDNYQKDSNYHWTIEGKEIDFKQIKERLNETLLELEENKIITSDHKKSIKEAIYKRLAPHEDWNKLTTNLLGLDDLIAFCKDNDIFLDQEYDVTVPINESYKIEIEADTSSHSFRALAEGMDALINKLYFDMDRLTKEQIEEGMKSIQERRNNIHIFTKHSICDIEEADKNIKVLCLIINELGSRISYRNEYIEQKSY